MEIIEYAYGALELGIGGKGVLAHFFRLNHQKDFIGVKYMHKPWRNYDT